jgi:hypothetical protein
MGWRATSLALELLGTVRSPGNFWIAPVDPPGNPPNSAREPLADEANPQPTHERAARAAPDQRLHCAKEVEVLAGSRLTEGDRGIGRQIRAAALESEPIRRNQLQRKRQVSWNRGTAVSTGKSVQLTDAQDRGFSGLCGSSAIPACLRRRGLVRAVLFCSTGRANILDDPHNIGERRIGVIRVSKGSR